MCCVWGGSRVMICNARADRASFGSEDFVKRVSVFLSSGGDGIRGDKKKAPAD